jgi:hypothetical protein
VAKRADSAARDFLICEVEQSSWRIWPKRSRTSPGFTSASFQGADPPNFPAQGVALAAGTYNVSVRYKASSGNIEAEQRRLFISTKDFP